MSMDSTGGQFALDLQGLQRLKQTASSRPEEGVREAAKQFEAIFLKMMLKSMRDATPQSGLLDSQQTRFYTEMLDQQWSQHLSGQGIGLAEKLVQQLEDRGLVPKADSASESLIAGIPRGTPRVLHGGLQEDQPVASQAADAPIEEPSTRFLDALELEPAGSGYESAARDATESTDSTDRQRPAHVAEFLRELHGPAQAASRTTGVPAELILAQAALETGWGRHEIPTADGNNSHNLFGIKAGSQWQGETTDITTTEYVDGRPVKMVDRFRVYDDFEAAFTDSDGEPKRVRVPLGDGVAGLVARTGQPMAISDTDDDDRDANDIAAAVMFLASEDAGFITGQSLAVNGGWVME